MNRTIEQLQKQINFMQIEQEKSRNFNENRLEAMDKQILRVYLYGLLAIVVLVLFNVFLIRMSQKSRKKAKSSDMASPAGNSGQNNHQSSSSPSQLKMNEGSDSFHQNFFMKEDSTPLNRIYPMGNESSDAFGPMKQNEYQMKAIEDNPRYKQIYVNNSNIDSSFILSSRKTSFDEVHKIFNNKKKKKKVKGANK